MRKLYRIGVPRTPSDSDGTIEQISFRMCGRTKRQFVSLISQRGLEIKEVLVEFIEHYIECEGCIGVVKLDDDFAPGKAPFSRGGRQKG